MKQQIVPIICLALFGIMALTIGQVHGQVVITPPNPTIQPGESVTLNATGATFLRWSPPEGLSTTVGPTTVATPDQTTTYTCFGCSPGEDKVVNGDFEQGNVGFTSEYEYNSNLWWESRYYVGSDASMYHSGFQGSPHGGDNFMIVNGATQENLHVWTEDIIVEPNTYYAFSTWVCSLRSGGNLARLQFSINNTQIGDVFTSPELTGTWIQFYQIWYSGSATDARITILNQNVLPYGNDFGLDDVSFCELIVNDQEDCTVTVEVLSAFDDNAAVCSGSPVEIDFLANDGLISVCDNMTCSIVQQPANGVATYQNNVIRYTPNAGYEGSDAIRYRIACGSQQAEATIRVTVFPVEERTIEAVACDAYPSPWSDSVYTQSGTYTHHFSTVHGCDSIVRLHLTINPSKEETIEAVACDTYQSPWCDSVYTQSGTYTHLFSTVYGCDSLVRLHLTINPSKEETIEAVGCNEYNSPWCDSVYTQSGTYTHHYSTVHGCDSVVRLHLTILTSETVNESDSACVLPYHWQTHGHDLGYLYDYGHHTQEVVMGDCYTTFNLDLTEQAFPAAVYFTEEACDSFFWQDSLFTQSTQYEVTVPQASGCDSTYVLDLTLHHSQENDIEAVGCNEYNSPWCDSVYTQSGTYTHHYSTVHGCDSVVRLHLTILTSETIDESDSTCFLPYHWQTHGHDLGYLYDYGHHTQEVVMGDCYTTFNLDLTEQAFPAAVYFTEEACDSFFWQDSLFTQSTQYEVTVPQASGCDSTYVLDLTLHHSQENDIEAVGCNEYNSPWCDSVYTQSGIYTHHYSTVHGCDSVVRLHLTILTSETIDESDSTCFLPYHWQTHGQDLGYLYDYGHHTQEVVMGDCYTTFNMDLTDQGMPAPVYFREETCDSFFWQDSLFTQSTHYEMSVPQASGCDSTYVLDLRLDYSPAPSEIIPLNTGTPHYVVPSTEFFVMETYYSIQDLVEGSYDSVRWTIEGSDWIVTPYGDSLSCGVHILGYVPDTVWLTARVYNDCAPDGVERRFWLLCSFFGTGEDLSQEVQVYPNPTDSKLTVQGDELRKVSVYDVYGQQVACYDNLSTNMQTIDVKRFAAAMYYVEVTTSRGKTIKKVVVRR